MRQILFQIGPLKFYSYGLMLGLSFALGIYLALWRARKENVSEEHVFNLSVGIVLSSLIGSKLLHILVNLSQFIEDPLSIIKHFGGGFVFYGGFLAAIIFVIIMNNRYKIGIFRLFDIYIPSVALGLGLTRIGCFLSGCCFGIPTNSPLGVVFPEGSFAYRQYGECVAVHPTQLYSSATGFLLFVILLVFLRWHGKHFHGQLFSLFLLLYPIFRFFVEFIRGDAGRGMFLGLYTSQIISIFGFILGLFIFFILPRISSNKLEQPIFL